MESLTIYVKDKAHIDFLYQFLQHLDFVVMPTVTTKKRKNTEYDFFKSAGLWKDRKISQEDLRYKAWKKV